MEPQQQGSTIPPAGMMRNGLFIPEKRHKSSFYTYERTRDEAIQNKGDH